MSVNIQDFREALGCFTTGVTVITTQDKTGAPLGVTVNSFNSVSLDPPLLLFCLDKAAYSFPAFEQAECFAVNVLTDDQEALSARFAEALADKWNGIPFETWETGSPIIGGCLANMDCVVEAVHDGGDHVIMVGRVLRLRATSSGEPLIFFRGEYAGLC